LAEKEKKPRGLPEPPDKGYSHPTFLPKKREKKSKRKNAETTNFPS